MAVKNTKTCPNCPKSNTRKEILVEELLDTFVMIVIPLLVLNVDLQIYKKSS